MSSSRLILMSLAPALMHNQFYHQFSLQMAIFVLFSKLSVPKTHSEVNLLFDPFQKVKLFSKASK